jgi:hypothetical protein
VGAVVECLLPGGEKLRRQRACGEGFAAQNSASLTIGIGAASQVEKLIVHWPGGQIQDCGPIPAGSLVFVKEGESAKIGPRQPMR